MTTKEGYKLMVKGLLDGKVLKEEQNNRGPSINYIRIEGGGGVNTNAYKCVQGGRGGSEHDQKSHLVRWYEF